MQTINLNFDWEFAPNFKDEYLKNTGKIDGFESVNIPHTVKEIPYNYFDEEMYQFVSCYRKTLFIAQEWQDKALVLQFEAVGHYAEVYVNGLLAVAHKGGYTSFSTDIAKFVKFGAENIITVKVDSNERADIPPFGNVIDYLCYGGIYREVYLKVLPLSYIANAYVTAVNALTAPTVQAKFVFSCPMKADVTVTVKDKDSKIVLQKTLKNNCGNAVEMQEKVEGKVNLWDTENPYLYSVEVEYCGETYNYNLGFREAKFTAHGFYLNGKKTKILGLNRHQSYPYVGYAMPKSAQVADADLLKSLGLNLGRTSHYPNSRHFLDRCDEIGLLVFTEIPAWQFISKDPEWRKNCVNNVREMINDGYNHPSIILWGVRINESSDDKELYTATNKLAHELDSTRQTGGVRCIPQSQLLEDVYTFNDFTHSGGKFALMPKFIVCGLTAPLLITEHNGHMNPTKRFDDEKHRQSQVERHAAVVNSAFRRNNTCGAIGWCMSDYNTHKDFGSGDKICYHGVTDMFRMDKTASYLYRAQQDKYPVLEVTSNMEIGDVAGGQVGEVYMLTNCDKINLYKNGKLINTFDVKELAKHSKYKHMPHPPILLYDIIGNQIEQDNKYGFSKHACKRLKKFLLLIKKRTAVPAVIEMLFTVLGLMMRYHLGVAELTDMFGKFVINWGDKSISYKFEGVKDGKTVVTEKCACQYATLSASADKLSLVENETYDVTRIEVKALSQTGNVLPYNNDIVTVSTDDTVEVLGDKTFALIGGGRAFWVKTVGKSGKAKITIDSKIGKQVIELDVKKM
ncbi:MAG: glycoside hydrolase family 2 TIM barrel-domain containing protein [Clostridia bacterium]